MHHSQAEREVWIEGGKVSIESEKVSRWDRNFDVNIDFETYHL